MTIFQSKEYHIFLRRTLGCNDFRMRIDFHRTRGGLDVSHIDSIGKIGSHLFYFMEMNGQMKWVARQYFIVVKK